MMVEVVGVGACRMEYLGAIDRFPEVDQSMDLSCFSMQIGGTSSLVMIALAVLGVRSAVVTKVSDDHFGRFVRKDLQQTGVDISSLVVESGKITPFHFVLVEQSRAKRKVFRTRGDVTPLRLDECCLDVLEGAKVLHIDGTQLDAQKAAAQKARSLGVHVIYNAHVPGESFHELIGLTDTLVASERFVAEIGIGPLAESLKELRKMGPESVVITVGEDGSVGMEASETYVVPALPVQVMDTTGAGECFQGAYIYGILRGWSLRERLRFANVAAGLCCRSLGARLGLPDLDEVQNHLIK